MLESLVVSRKLSSGVNFDGTVGLARAACGIARRFVFMSSVKVHGKDSGDGAYTEEDPLRPKEGANCPLVQIGPREH